MPPMRVTVLKRTIAPSTTNGSARRLRDRGLDEGEDGDEQGDRGALPQSDRVDHAAEIVEGEVQPGDDADRHRRRSASRCRRGSRRSPETGTKRTTPPSANHPSRRRTTPVSTVVMAVATTMVTTAAWSSPAGAMVAAIAVAIPASATTGISCILETPPRIGLVKAATKASTVLENSAMPMVTGTIAAEPGRQQQIAEADGENGGEETANQAGGQVANEGIQDTVGRSPFGGCRRHRSVPFGRAKGPRASGEDGRHRQPVQSAPPNRVRKCAVRHPAGFHRLPWRA